MNKTIFLRELEQYLQGISEEERKEAVAVFEVAELGENYEAFVDIQDV